MGISEIERKLKDKRAYTLKSMELRLVQLVSDPSYKCDSEQILERLTAEFGADIFEDKNIVSHLASTLQGLNINPEKIFGAILFKDSVFEKNILGRLKVNHKKLGMLLLQRASLLKNSRGGLFTIGELLNWFNSGVERKISVEDVLKAVRILEKNKIIPGRRVVGDNVTVIQFLPLELTSDHKVILDLACDKGWVTLEDASRVLNWPLERVNMILVKLVEYGLAKVDSSYSHGKKYYFPAFLNK